MATAAAIELPSDSIFEDPDLAARKLIALVGTPLLLTDLLHLGVAPRQLILESSISSLGTEHLGGHISRGL